MSMLEIVLLIIGGIIFTVSFFISDKSDKNSGVSKEMAQEEIRELVKKELDGIKGHVDDVVEETVTYTMEKTERSLERLSNEKIMAINEYSDTVLSEIHKNHEEAMFLYDMLNSKHANLKNTVSEVNKTVKEAEETVSSFQRIVPETVAEPAKEEPEAIPKKKSSPTKETKTDNGKKISKPVFPVIEETPTVEDAPVTDKKSSYVESAELTSLLEETEEEPSKNDKVLDLYRQGKSKVMIAKELGIGVGEVNLIIDLFKNQ